MDFGIAQPALALRKERRIDWPRMIREIQRQGMSLQEIADAIQMSRSALYGYLSEDCPSEPAYYVGHCLVGLWCTKCGRTLSDVPVREVPLSISAMLKALG